MRKLSWLTLTFIFVLMVLFVSTASADLVIDQSYQLINKKRVGRTVYEYTYQVNISNNGSDVQNVTASVTGSSPHTIIVDGDVNFGDITGGGTVTSTDTFSFRQDRRYPFDPSTLSWDAQSEVTICHFPPDNPENPQTITISDNVLEAHLAHGDTLGSCNISMPVPTFTAYTNPGDSLILTAQTPNGEFIEYFGIKDTDGFATLVNYIRFTDSGGDITVFQLDSEGRPVQIFAFNGVVFNITWQSDTLILITAISADGSIQANVSFDLSAQTSNSLSLTTTTDGTTYSPLEINRAPRDGKAVQLITNELKQQIDIVLSGNVLSATSSSLVDVKRCETPVNNAAVDMLVAPKDGTSFKPYILYGTLVGDGTYSVTIPTMPSTIGDQAEAICKSIADPLGKVCSALGLIPVGSESLICSSIAAAIDLLLGGPTGEGVPIAAACVSGFAAARTYCSTLGSGGPVTGPPSLADFICANIDNLVDRYAGEDYFLAPSADIPGVGGFAIAGKTAPAEGPFPNFVIDAAGAVDIVSFTSNPADPLPFQDYVATTVITCAPPNTSVTMSIVGTDGYTDSIVCVIDGDDSCLLNVPGAEEGIVDTVTVSISNGPSKQIVLVF